jgi:NAD(P)H-flavin reductase
MENIYLPKLARINKITVENEAGDLKTFEVSFLKEEDRDGFKYLPGQFVEVSLFGVGESPFGIASSPTEKGILKFTVKRVGKVTTALHEQEVGEILGIRGPLGNSYPLNEMENKNVVIIGGGFAFTTLRSLTIYILKNRDKFKDLTIIYGARTPGELMYKEELKEWEKYDLNLVLTVDRADENWKRREGFVPTITKEVAPSPDNAIAVVCGPPIMIKFTLPVLYELKFSPKQVYTSLEMRMKCGIGKCGRCNIGTKYVCIDGPVFSCEELLQLPQEY